jgi:chorismate-pyruvate lyase
MHRPPGRSPGDIPPSFRCDGYVPEGLIHDEHGLPVPLVELPPFLRALLVTDGTVTKALEAYFWEPVAVDTLEQCFERAPAAVPTIGVRAGDQCLVRTARLRGVHSGRDFARARSVIRTELIPEDFRRRLVDREIGIGALIRDSGLESYREVLDVGVERNGAAGEAVFRTYRIIIGGHPVILITEHFPLALFREH